MSTKPATSSRESNTRSAHLAGPEASVRLVTVMVGIVVGLTFLFGFGNVATLGVRLGVPTYVAFLVAPAVDFSVVALLLGTRHLALHDGPAEVVRSARRLLIFSSTVTLALNIAEPLIAGHYGKAAFDAVGCLCFVAVWRFEVRCAPGRAGPCLPGILPERGRRGSAVKGGRRPSRSDCGATLDGGGAAPDAAQRTSNRLTNPAAHCDCGHNVGPLLLIGWAEVGPSLLQAMQISAVSASVLAGKDAGDSPGSILAAQPVVPPLARQRVEAGAPSAEVPHDGNGSGARYQDLLHRARAEDVLHWQLHRRPISAETLRKRLHVGAGTARNLVAQLRSDARAAVDDWAPPSPTSRR